MTTQTVSRQEYLNNILQLAAGTDSRNSNADWAQHPGMYSRALHLLKLRLVFYQDLSDWSGMEDTQWAIEQVRKQLKAGGK